MAAQDIKITDKHRAALMQLFAAFGERRFRRSDLSARVYPLTSPRSLQRLE